MKLYKALLTRDIETPLWSAKKGDEVLAKHRCYEADAEYFDIVGDWEDGFKCVCRDVLNIIDVVEVDGTPSLPQADSDAYEMVNHPSHYNNYSVEVIEMMERIYGARKTMAFCEMNAFKYRMRLGTKPDNSIEQDLAKEKWYLNKARLLRAKLENNESN
jgi:hypothetical protein